jgi:hypothetical protein
MVVALGSIPSAAVSRVPDAARTAEAAPVAPDRLWVVWLDDRTLDHAIATGARVIDRFPDAVIVSDPVSAQALRAAAFRVEAPIDVPAGRSVTIIRGHGPTAETRLDPDLLATSGIQLLWQGGADAIVTSDGPLPEIEELLSRHRQALRMRSTTSGVAWSALSWRRAARRAVTRWRGTAGRTSVLPKRWACTSTASRRAAASRPGR